MARITCQPNGPYSLQGDAEAVPVRRASGETFPPKPSVSLCRCGGSASKPFCDGTHRRNGFSDANRADPAQNKRQAYAGRKVTIHDNRALCAHAGYCTDGLNSVFKHRETPWIDPDGATVAEIAAVVSKCPSGALSYSIDDVEPDPPQRAPMVTVTDNGPYAITGGIELVGQGASAEHYTLCRCGASKNKPFCDGTHWEVQFRDP